mgnify:FL=1
MAMPRISMDLQKEIQFLKPLLKHQRKVARHLKINRETVAKYWDQERPVSEMQGPPPSWSEKIDWDYVKQENKNGVSLKTLYREFSSTEELPIYPNFVRYYRLHIKESNQPIASLKVERIPGQTIEVDYSGDKIPILNPATGEIFEAELFVATLSFSSYFYGEFTFSQKLPDFLNE